MATFERSGRALFRSGRLIGTWPRGDDPDPQACGQRLELDGVPLSEIANDSELELRRCVTRYGYPDYGQVLITIEQLVENDEPGEPAIASERPQRKGQVTIHCHSLRVSREEQPACGTKKRAV